MNILIAPDSFKGSLTAIEFCQIAAQQIQSVKRDAHLILLPMADGGEGTIDAILANVTGQRRSIQVHDPLSKIIDAQYAILDEQHTAIIEMACASGLPLLKPEQLNPMLATSYGTGEIIIDALEQRCRRLIIGLGGSATNDGGTGMLEALGVQFFDRDKCKIRASGQALQDIDTIDCSNMDSRLKDCEFIIAGDVTNPLLGINGATSVFGPQKGADETMLPQFEAGLQNFVNKTDEILDSVQSIATQAGSGAAGGMAYALMAYCQATMHSGFELIADMTQLDTLLRSEKTRPDLIISGEGRFDNQSLQGKLTGRLCQRADKYQIPLVIICGTQAEDLSVNRLSQNIKLYSLSSEDISVEYSMNNTADLLKKMILNIINEHSFF